MIRPALALAATGLALASCAPAQDGAPAAAADGARAEGRSCFSARSVSGFRSAPESASGAEQVYIDVGVRDTYLFETFGGCPELDFSWRIGLEQRIPGQICDGFDADLVIPDPTFGPRRCPVRMVRKLAPGEEGARR